MNSTNGFNLSRCIALATMASRAIWYEFAVRQAIRNTLFLRCDITTGAPTSRQGIVAITEPAIKISVAAPAREKRANKAVVKVLAEVGKPC